MGKGFNPNDYTEVKDRLKWYKEDYKDYRIETEVVASSPENNSVIIKASIFKNLEEQLKRVPHATGLAEELRDAGFINKTSHVENCETSAIGRALANIDYHGSEKRPSREEMDKVKRTEKAKAKQETKESKPEKPKEKEVETADDVVDTINNFDEETELIKWFNDKIKELEGDESNDFRQTYISAVQSRLSEIR